MGSIRDKSVGRTLELEPEYLVGRAPACALRLDHRYVSAQHALLRWTGHGWELKDLGSRNGTYLDGHRVAAGSEVPIGRHVIIAFGKLEEQWELVDDSAPAVMAVPLDGGDPVLLDGDLLALPSSQDPRATIYRSAGGTWILEPSDASALPIANLEVFEAGGRTWRFSCDESVSATSVLDPTAKLYVAGMELTFLVSRDEEHVEIRAKSSGRTFDMRARSHNYLLLTLARRRLADAAAGLPETTCGWIDHEDLAHDPSMAPPQLNIDVFRLRKQFAAAGVLDPANVIERRPRTRQLRIGTGRISVVVV